jgi:hypothetical protein
MKRELNSAEFQQLVTRWLDGQASAAEAELLFSAIHSSAAHALAFARAARFEHLLVQTFTAAERETSYLGAAEKSTQRYYRQLLIKRSFQVAAAVALCGWLGWLLWPPPEQPPAVTTVMPVPAQPVRQRLLPTTVVMSRSQAKPTPAKPYRKQLDDFFLTALSFDDLPLVAAIQELKAMAKELNMDHDALFEQIQIRLPAEAAQRRITLRCGAISFLKAVHTVASLAHCEVQLEGQLISLQAHPLPTSPIQKEEEIDRLLAGDKAQEPTLLAERRKEMLGDAQSLGMKEKTNAQGHTELEGTAEQFAALDQLTQSRDQIRAMPPVSLMAMLQPGTNEQKERLLTQQETATLRRETHSWLPLTLRPTADDAGLQEVLAQPKEKEPDLLFSVRPAGDGHIAVTFTGDTISHSEDLKGHFTDAVLQPGQAVVVPINQGFPSVMDTANRRPWTPPSNPIQSPPSVAAIPTAVPPTTTLVPASPAAVPATITLFAASPAAASSTTNLSEAVSDVIFTRGASLSFHTGVLSLSVGDSGQLTFLAHETTSGTSTTNAGN